MTDLISDAPIRTESRALRGRQDIEQVVKRYFTEFELPSPEALAEYERISPGAAEKIIQLRTVREEHARQWERQLEAHHWPRGWMAFVAIIFVGLILSLVLLVYKGPDWVRVIATVTPAIVGLLSATAFRAS